MGDTLDKFDKFEKINSVHELKKIVSDVVLLTKEYLSKNETDVLPFVVVSNDEFDNLKAIKKIFGNDNGLDGAYALEGIGINAQGFSYNEAIEISTALNETGFVNVTIEGKRDYFNRVIDAADALIKKCDKVLMILEIS